MKMRLNLSDGETCMNCIMSLQIWDKLDLIDLQKSSIFVNNSIIQLNGFKAQKVQNKFILVLTQPPTSIYVGGVNITQLCGNPQDYDTNLKEDFKKYMP